jgi:hypothetical protein
MPNALDTLETRIQNLIEENLLAYLPVNKPASVLAREFATAVQSNLTIKEHKQLAPNAYALAVSPTSLHEWQQDHRLLEGLAHILNLVTIELGFTLTTTPSITIVTDQTLPPGEIRVVARHRTGKLNETQAVPQTGELTEIPRNAFLIIGGTRVFALDKPTINLGRRADNHIVIDDPRVSRYHAQLRVIRNRFVLFDLNSTGGTYVNGQRVTQTILYPGDVLSLAGLPLIFGQDNPPHSGRSGGTAPISNLSSERPTAALRQQNLPEDNKKSQ